MIQTCPQKTQSGIERVVSTCSAGEAVAVMLTMKRDDTISIYSQLLFLRADDWLTCEWVGWASEGGGVWVGWPAVARDTRCRVRSHHASRTLHLSITASQTRAAATLHWFGLDWRKQAAYPTHPRRDIVPHSTQLTNQPNSTKVKPITRFLLNDDVWEILWFYWVAGEQIKSFM